MKITVNQETCIGCGACQAIAEDLFEINENGLAQAKVEEVPAELQADATDAKEACPVGAIEA